MFTDPETGFSISGADEVQLPVRMGRLTREVIQAGGLLLITDEETQPEAKATLPDDPVPVTTIQPEPVAEVAEDTETEEIPEDAELACKFYTREEIDGLLYHELHKLAQAFGLRYGKRRPKFDKLRDDFMAHQEKIRAAL